jgi:hypothetical protein
MWSKNLLIKLLLLKDSKCLTIKDKVYASGRKVRENFKKNIKIVFDDNLGKWNYKAIPSVKA